MTRKYLITGPIAREAICKAIMEAQEGEAVVIRDSDRSLEQNAMFHALCTKAAEALSFQGRKRTAMEWKVLFVSGHSFATGAKPEVVSGLEGEWLNIRESTAAMGKRRMNSLIEYVQAYLANQGIEP